MNELPAPDHSPPPRPLARRRVRRPRAPLGASRPARVRLGFLLGSVLLGLGALVYLAAWLILPAESADGVTAGQRGIVLLAQLTGALLGLATLAVAGAAATLFGFGWAVVGLACIVLVCVARRLGAARARLGAAADRRARAAVGRARGGQRAPRAEHVGRHRQAARPHRARSASTRAGSAC